MRCPNCNHAELEVKDSRKKSAGNAIKRRRMCVSCGAKFTTYEEIKNLQTEEQLKQLLRHDVAIRKEFAKLFNLMSSMGFGVDKKG